jgi:hypothetical protein
LMLFLSPQKLQGWHQRHSQNHKRWRFYTEVFTQRSFYTEAFTRSSFYTQELLHTHKEAFTHRNFYTNLHRAALIYTQKLLHRLFTHRGATVPQKLIARCWTERFSKLGPDSS